MLMNVACSVAMASVIFIGLTIRHPAHSTRPRNGPCPLDQVRLFLRLGFALRFRKGIHLRRRIYTLRLVQQALDSENLDLRIVLVVPKLRLVTASVRRLIAH